MNIKQLRYFIGIVRHKSFSKAADELGLTQPALSLQIQKLEEECEFMLIDRSRKPLEISPEGFVFYEKALQILQLVDDLDRLSIDMIDGIERQLRVGIIPTLAPYIVPLFIDKLQLEYPELHLQVEELLTEDIISKLNYNELDMGVYSTPVHTKNIVHTPIAYEKFYIYVSPKHPLYEQDEIKIEDISLDDMFFLSEDHCLRSQIDSVCLSAKERSKRLNFEYTSNSIESIKRLIESKNGLAIIPELSTSCIPSEFENMVKPISNSFYTREISIAYLKTTGLKTMGKHFIKTASESIPKRMREKPFQNSLDTFIKV